MGGRVDLNSGHHPGCWHVFLMFFMFLKATWGKPYPPPPKKKNLFTFICRWGCTPGELTYYIRALATCQHRRCLETEQHISTFMPLLQATGSSLMPCPNQHWDQQSTSIFHLLWLLPPISLPDDFSHPVYQAPLMEESRWRWWWREGAWSTHRIPKGFHPYLLWDESLVTLKTHSYCFCKERIKSKPSPEILVETV